MLASWASTATANTTALVEIEVTLDGPTPAKIFSLADPKRVVLDISGKVERIHSDDVNPLISDIRMGNHPFGTRVVLDLSQSASLIDAKYGRGGASLIVRLAPAAQSLDAQSQMPIVLQPKGLASVAAVTRPRARAGNDLKLHPVGDATAILHDVFGIRPTSAHRPANHPLSLRNPKSYHTLTHAAVDVRPIAGMSFDQFVGRFRDEGFEIIEALNEVGSGRTAHATGDHWHIVLGEWR